MQVKCTVSTNVQNGTDFQKIGASDISVVKFRNHKQETYSDFSKGH